MNNGWPVVSLGDVLQIISREEVVEPTSEYRLAGVRLDGAGPFLRESKLGSQVSAKKLARLCSGDFIYSRLFAWRGAFGVVPPELDGAYVSNEFPTFAARDGKVHHDYLKYWFRLRSVLQAVEADCSGSTPLTRNRYKEEYFLKLTMPLPPVAEQRRIVAKIDELAANIAEARGLRQTSEEECGHLTGAYCNQVLTPGDWPTKTVDELVGRANLRNGNSPKSSDDGCRYRCLRLSALSAGIFDCSDSKPVPLSDSEAAPYIVCPGDVFVMRGNGSRDLVGRAGRVVDNVPDTIFPDLLIRVPLERTGLTPEFFVLYWNSPRNRKVIEDMAKTTSGIWKINQGHIAQTPVPLPPLPEQRRIVAHLDELQAKVDRLKALQAQTAAELDALLPAILDKAFKGEL